ncbi:hypothetical protein [Rhizobium sp. C4]|uniref:hypothetical protein n=1 Tax=Rhizobium sp. C4 TaxID=1349800 RepID=UPI001E47EEAC|nr:hypothetical protein [Rhizobium sp. C4]MCD2173071.1 hypothetical protein [Rhizobium sp. C4]
MLNSVSVQRAQGVSTSVASPREQEEKQKKISIPSVEVTAAQSQGFAARVGDFLVNKASQSSDAGSAVSGPTGADGMPPAGMPIGGPPPGPPPQGAQGEGLNGGNGSGSAASILSLLSGETGTSDTENDGDADDSGFAIFAKQSQGANTQYALQQGGNGVFGVQFDEIGAYQFAAAAG